MAKKTARQIEAERDACNDGAEQALELVMALLLTAEYEAWKQDADDVREALAALIVAVGELDAPEIPTYEES